MPTLHLHVNVSQTQDEKRRLTTLVTDAVADTLGKKPEDVTLYLHYHVGGDQDMAFGGSLVSDNRPE